MSGQVVIIGAGHNGLTAAALLAKAGQRVTVLEARDRVGGLAAREELGDGYAIPGMLHDTRAVREALVDSLGLGRHGLERRPQPLRICAPSAEAEPIWLEGDAMSGADEDAEAYGRWRGFIARVAPALRALLDQAPPEPTSELWPMVKTAVSVRRLGASDMLELLRVAPMCIADWMRDTFASERLGAALALPAVQGEFLGPWSAGSAATLLMQEVVAAREIAGGGAALSAALETAAKGFGAEIRTEAEVKQIVVKGGRVEAVVLSDGERVEAAQLLATCDPKQTFLRLIGPQRLPVDLADDMRRLRARGTSAKVHLGLSGPLALPDGTELEALRTGESLNTIEQAFDAIKYRRFSERPALDVRVPSMSTSGLVPEEGHHVVSIWVSYAPHDLDGGWNDEQRDALGDAVVEELARYCPDVKERIVVREVLTPSDIAERHHVTNGCVLHAEHAPDQMLFMRPSVDCAKYSTPVQGLYLGGSGCHPGGGISCAPGALAARRMLALSTTI